MSKQPIHETIKLTDKRQVERFELTWEMIERLNHEANVASSRGLEILIDGNNHAALEIILQCRTFKPGMFEKKNGRWHRAGESKKE